MAKKSQRRSLRYEKDQAGCMWGFISIFDFRRGLATRKLLADRRRANRQVGAASSPKLIIPDSNEESLIVEDDEEREVATLDVKTRVKELMEEDMSSKPSNKNPRNDTEIEPELYCSHQASHTTKTLKKTYKTCKRSRNLSLSDLDDIRSAGSGVSHHKVLNSDDLQVAMEEHGQNCLISREGNLHTDTDQSYPVLEEKLSAAIEVFINHKLKNSKPLMEDEITDNTKELTDALQTLRSNKELFRRLLQDPNSRLVKHIESLEDGLEKGLRSNSMLKSNFSENKPVCAKTDEIIVHKQPHFFRRRSRSQGSYPLMEDVRSQPPSKIVILKPGPVHFPGTQLNADPSSHSADTMKNKVQNERNSSYFSFTEIKRKLKHAMGKDRQGISPEGVVRRVPPEYKKRSESEKGITGENAGAGWSSPNRNHFYTERFAKPSSILKRGDKRGKPKDAEEAIRNETSDYPKQGVPNIYLEAKKHIFEMLDNGEEKEEPMRMHLPRSLGRILSLPDYYTSPSSSSSNSDSSDEQIPSSQMRVAPPDSLTTANQSIHQTIHEDREICQFNLETQSCVAENPSNQDIESDKANLNVPCEHYHDIILEANVPSHGGVALEGTIDTEESSQTRCQEDDRVSNAPLEISSSSITINMDSAHVTEACIEESSSQSLELAPEYLKTESQGAAQILSSPPASLAQSLDTRRADPDCVMDRTERPSPISVLEPLFMEDDISPASTVCRSVELEIQPRKIHFEEPAYSTINQPLCIRTCLESEETAFEYVEAVLLGSDLNWDDFLLRWLSSDQILDPSLFDEVELFSSRSCHDQKLLFDCTNEVLKEVVDRYFGCFSCTPILKQNIRPVPKGMDLIHEVWNGVEWYLLKNPPPHSLEQLVRKHLARSGEWMDLQYDIGNIGIGIEATILEDLLEETIFILADDTTENDILSSADKDVVISCD
ncbi:uncharacterized protein LOC116015280 isoform X1 [Ipomoea triloba]|uniref:uncharacterized protein LOC116015280 isoform X1 n=1 Tax=Ipomoea triloba TaxID=35885 RepID=UPI00125E8373|nr:uncharacterized protein LOC116015280 isoform X1 [Ipomoea triloba]XP_031111173.1 uncharacterized protein LOC116015280 isoform X1 [Ipomoea triloba]